MAEVSPELRIKVKLSSLLGGSCPHKHVDHYGSLNSRGSICPYQEGLRKLMDVPVPLTNIQNFDKQIIGHYDNLYH